MSDAGEQNPALRRGLGVWLLTFYGIGTIVGGGFYALTGRVAADAGMLTPIALGLAGIIAAFSAASYAELSARYPFSAGEAHFVEQAFAKPWLGSVIGWMVIATGVVSAATLAVAFSAFVQRFVALPAWPLIVACVLVLGLVTAWGITESAVLSLVITLLEVGGLLLVLAFAGNHLSDVPRRVNELLPSASFAQWSGICMGAYLAFYSFIGFEDMVNVAEEVKNPRRNMPIAILASVGLTSLLYVVVSLVIVLAATPEELSVAESPLSLAFGPWHFGGDAIAVIGALAGLNGALVQIVMASRVVYGLAGKGHAPAIFNRVNRITRTPLEATAAISVVVLALALWLPLETLAKTTSTVLLAVYALVNVSLWRIKRRHPQPPEGAPRFPVWVPIAGTCVCLAFLIFHAVTGWRSAG